MSKKINFQFLISYFGLIPYVLTFLDKYYFLVVEEEDLLNFVTYYSLIIIVFIGSINWNLKNNPPTYIVIYGFLPSLFAVIIIILSLLNINILIIFILIILLLLTQLFFDYKARRKQQAKVNASQPSTFFDTTRYQLMPRNFPFSIYPRHICLIGAPKD